MVSRFAAGLSRLAEPSRWRSLANGSLQILVLLIAGVAVSITVAMVVWLQVTDHQRMEFEWVSHDRNRALKKGVEDTLDAIQSVADFLRVGADIGPAQFRSFADAVVARHPAVRGLEWLPRDGIPDQILSSGAVAGGIGEALSEATPEPEPMPSNGAPNAAGDAAGDGAGDGAGDAAGHESVEAGPAERASSSTGDRTDPTSRALLAQVIRTGRTAVSQRIPIGPESNGYAVMVFAPVVRPVSVTGGRDPALSNDADSVLGVVVGLVDLAVLAEGAVSVLEPRGVECVLRDQSAPPGEGFLDFYASRLEAAQTPVQGQQRGWTVPDARHVTEHFAVADRQWSVTCAPTPRYRSAVGLRGGPWIVFAGCLAVTLLTVMFLHSLRQEARARLGVEQELRASEQQLRVLFSQSPDIIMTVNERGRIIMVNRPWPKAPDESAVGRNSSKLLPKGLRKWYRNALKAVLASGDAEHFEYSETDSSYWDVRIVPLRGERAVSRAMVIATDVTERRLLEAQAIRSARFATLGVLSASVAHEINNPNNAIQFNGTLLQRSFADMVPILRRESAARGDFLIGGVPVEQAIDGMPRMLKDLLRNTQRIQGIVANLKRMAAHDPGDYGARVDLAKVLHAAYSILQHKIQKHTDDCELSLPETLPQLNGNAQQLEQVFVNLLLNALQALPDRRARVWITVSVAAEGKRVRVAVVDQGKGIDDADLARIFDPFFTTRTEEGGTGLGLSISRRIVQNHGGSIAIDSVPSVGTEVVVYLPVAETQA